MPGARLNIIKTSEIPNPTYYVEALNGEYANFALNEVRAENFRGQWRAGVFLAPNKPLDLEIGTGNGFFFAHHAEQNPNRNLIGIEIKFKPLIQAIRRALRAGAVNARIVRYDAGLIENLFQPGEIDNVYIHHPDPWNKRRRQKRRLLNQHFLSKLHSLQTRGSFLDFKTDSQDYFHWVVGEIEKSQYKVVRRAEDLHSSPWQVENFVTHFERIYMEKGQPIYYLRALRSDESLFT